jgi:hypothetical protein
MEKLAVFELSGFLLAIPISYIMARVIRNRSKPGYRDEIDSDYLREWTGDPEDEFYAWLRLRNRYLQQDSPPGYSRYVNQKMDSLTKRDMLSVYSVNRNGQVILTNSSFKPEKDNGGELNREDPFF